MTLYSVWGLPRLPVSFTQLKNFNIHIILNTVGNVTIFQIMLLFHIILLQHFLFCFRYFGLIKILETCSPVNWDVPYLKTIPNNVLTDVLACQ